MAGEAHLSEDKAQKAMIDAARLADELRGEQEHAQVRENEQFKTYFIQQSTFSRYYIIYLKNVILDHFSFVIVLNSFYI